MIEMLAVPLLAALVVELARRRMPSAAPEASLREAPAWSWHAVRVAVLLAAALWFVGTPVLGAGPMPFAGDLDGHVLVAQAIARGGASRGWVDAVASGFPLGYHYPPLGFGVLAALLRMGFSPARAVSLVALFAWIVPPLVVVEVSRARRVHPCAALLGALFLLAVEPFSSFVTAWTAVARRGLVSQALGGAFAALWMGSTLHPRGRLLGALAALALVASHPQIFAATTAALGLLGVAALDRAFLLRTLATAAPATLTALLLYGPGIQTLHAPFGWPPNMGWLHAGVSPQRVRGFVEGELVDFGRPPVLTVAWVFSLYSLAFRGRERAARAAVAATLGVMALAVSGALLEGLGGVGRAIMSVFQPLRMLTVLPLLGAGALVLAADGALRVVHGFPRRRRVGYALLALAGLGLVPELYLRSSAARAELVMRRDDVAGGQCSVDGVSVTIDEDFRTRLRALRGGRFSIDLPMGTAWCLRAAGVALDMAVSQGSTNAVGAHVGVAWAAFQLLEHGAPEAAEALGVRWILTRASQPVPAAFRVAWARGPLALLERASGGELVGASCVVEEWRGSERALTAALFSAFDRPGELFADPLRSVALVRDESLGDERSLVRVPVAHEPCGARESRVTEGARSSGVIEATVENGAPVDLVFRVSALPAWRVEVDGAETPWRRVAPGFIAVRVPAGRRHVVKATVHLARYGWLVALATLAGIGVIGGLEYRLARKRRAAR